MTGGRDGKRRARLGLALVTGGAAAGTNLIAAEIGLSTFIAMAASLGAISILAFLASGALLDRSAVEAPADNLELTSPALTTAPQERLSIPETQDKASPSFAVQASVFERLFERAAQSNASVTDETEAAAQDIMTQLQRVDRSVSALLNYLQEANGRVLEIVARTEKGINDNRRAIAEFLDRRSGDIFESQSHLVRIEDVTKSLAKSTQSIRTIARQSNMLALNATIEASRAGEFGAGFTVVANEVKTLAKLSDSSAEEIAMGIESLRKSVHNSVVLLVESRIESEKTELDHISSTIGDLTQQTEQLVAFERELLGKVQSESERIGDSIVQVIGSIQFQDVTRQRLDHLNKIFDLAQRHMQDVSATGAAESMACSPSLDCLASAVEEEGPSTARRRVNGAIIELF